MSVRAIVLRRHLTNMRRLEIKVVKVQVSKKSLLQELAGTIGVPVQLVKGLPMGVRLVMRDGTVMDM